VAALPYCLGVLAIRSRDGYGWRPAKLRTGKAAALVRLTGSGAFRTFALERAGACLKARSHLRRRSCILSWCFKHAAYLTSQSSRDFR
jgi:hypothetical protein